MVTAEIKPAPAAVAVLIGATLTERRDLAASRVNVGATVSMFRVGNPESTTSAHYPYTTTRGVYYISLFCVENNVSFRQLLRLPKVITALYNYATREFVF